MYRLRYIFLGIISLFVSISCTTEDNEFDETMIYWSSVFYPSSISNQYRVLFNGSEVNYIPKGQNSGKLEVLLKTDDDIVLSIENATMVDNKFWVSRYCPWQQSSSMSTKNHSAPVEKEGQVFYSS